MTQPSPLEEAVSSEEGSSDPLLVCPPIPTDSSESSDDDDDDDMQSAQQVLVRFPKEPLLTEPDNKATPQRKTSLLYKTITRWLDFYVRFLQTSPAHQDRLLKTLQWTTWLASAALQRAKSTQTAVVLEKLSLDLSFARYATRLLEWPTALQAAFTGSWTARSTQQQQQHVMNQLGRLLSWSMVGYYPAECVAYVLWMLPTQFQSRFSNKKAAQLSAWSCRAWFVYLTADLVQSVLQWKEQQQQLKENETSLSSSSLTLQQAKLQTLRSALFMLPCIHWSLPNWDTKPWLPTNVVNGLMWLESIVSLYQSGLVMVHQQPTSNDGKEKEE